ncbi:MAG: hypothetical protein O3B01_30380 [Planctomycetota bacterium]|nr:hypothetical protein [Planctomycetota bacterium]
MRAKVIRTQVGAGGLIHIEDRDLPPGPADLVVLYREEDVAPTNSDVNRPPLGGYKAGWIEPRSLRREAMYEEG